MTIDWEQWAAMIGVFGAVLSVWWRVESMFRKNTDALAAHKLHVSENYTKKSDLAEATDRIMAAIGGLNDSVNHIAQRMDNFVDKRPNSRMRST